MRTLCTLFLFSLWSRCEGLVRDKPASTPTCAFSPPLSPLLGIGAILFRPQNIKIVKATGEADRLVAAGRFFVDAFWTGKVGGAKKLSLNQAESLERQQIAEFKKRYTSRAQPLGKLPGQYATRTSDSRAELVLCLDAKGECIGCAGVEVDKIRTIDGGYDSSFGPVMSNLAVSRKYRRKGLAEDLVKATETIARKEWGFESCYLYVEKRNTPAVKLYQKMGYKIIWEDPNASTLLPMSDGRVSNGKTVLLCMRKKVGIGLFGNLFGK